MQEAIDEAKEKKGEEYKKEEDLDNGFHRFTA